MNIKNIVEPYEKRIKELEETIRSKDFEIAVLKQKLFNLTKTQKSNTQFSNNNLDDKINVIFIDDKNNEKKVKCRHNEKTKKMFERYLIDSLYEINNLIFTCDNQILQPFKRLNENGIGNNSIIHVKSKKLRSLAFERNGYCNGFTFDENISVGIAFIYYLIEIGEENTLMDLLNNEKPISFIRNQQLYSIRDKTRIKDIFPHLSRILVIEHGNIIGGK